MAAIESLWRAHLAGYSGVSALVSTRVYPQKAPQDVVSPYIVFQKISDVEALTKPENATLRLKRARIQVDAYAKGASAYSAIKGLETAIKAAAYAFNSGVNAAVVQTRVADSVDGQEADEGFFRVSIDVSILYNE
jgi:hypothetical protein